MGSTYLASLASFRDYIYLRITGRRIGRDEGREDEWEKKGGRGEAEGEQGRIVSGTVQRVSFILQRDR